MDKIKPVPGFQTSDGACFAGIGAEGKAKDHQRALDRQEDFRRVVENAIDALKLHTYSRHEDALKLPTYSRHEHELLVAQVKMTPSHMSRKIGDIVREHPRDFTSCIRMLTEIFSLNPDGFLEVAEDIRLHVKEHYPNKR